MKMTNVDIAIIGGGMVGLTFAAALRETDLRIAIIENTPQSTDISAEHATRVSAINRASEYIFRHINAWDGMLSRRHQCIEKMSVWEQDSFGGIDFSAAELSEPNLGYIIENQVIQLALFEQVSTQHNVQFYHNDACQHLLFSDSEAWLTLESGKALSAKLVVGADGAHSWLRTQLAIGLTQWDYDQHAMVATIRCALPHENIARQIFTPEGPLALLPLDDPTLCSMVWSMPPDKAAALQQCESAEFNKALTAAFDARLGLCQLASERDIHPLKMRFAKDFINQRAALIGDAAHTIHPLAGQGVNLGLLDAMALAETVILLSDNGKDIGAKANLRQLERWRKTEAAQMIAAIQGFRELFSGENPAKKLFRSVGLLAAANLPFVKTRLIKQALGLCGELPNAAKYHADKRN